MGRSGQSPTCVENYVVLRTGREVLEDDVDATGRRRRTALARKDNHPLRKPAGEVECQRIQHDRLQIRRPELVTPDVELPVRLPNNDLERSEEHTSELQSHSFISYAVF